MAPPTPSASTSTSGNKNNDKESKKVTPAQVAFLVERYLADNGFNAALAAFRSDAAHLFKPNHPKPTPKGLIPLANILHDYITLKESRLAIDSAMHAMHSLVSTYYSNHPPPVPQMLPPPPAGTSQPASPPLVPPLFVSSSSSPPATQGYASPVVHHYAHASTAVVVHNSSAAVSTPADPTSLPTKKRKPTKSAGKSASAAKRSCIAPAATSHTKAKEAVSQLSVDNQEQNMVACAVQPSSTQHSVPIQSSSVAKSLFGPLQPQIQPAPSTSQQPEAVAANAHAQDQHNTSPTQCSIVSSSKTLIVSPLKGGAYYAVERSYHVSSPLKSTIHKSSKREHVKGKLNFDTTDARPTLSNEHICDQMAASTSSDGNNQDDFEIDFTNLDIFDTDFSFSELLLDLDLDTEGAEVQRSAEPVAMDPVLPDSVKTVAADPTEDFTSQGVPSVTSSVRAITKRIKIVSPVKGRTSH